MHNSNKLCESDVKIMVKKNVPSMFSVTDIKLKTNLLKTNLFLSVLIKIYKIMREYYFTLLCLVLDATNKEFI